MVHPANTIDDFDPIYEYFVKYETIFFINFFAHQSLKYDGWAKIYKSVYQKMQQ